MVSGVRHDPNRELAAWAFEDKPGRPPEGDGWVNWMGLATFASDFQAAAATKLASPAAFSCLANAIGAMHRGYRIEAVSWDIFVQDLPSGVRNTSEIPDDFHPQPLGRRDDIIARIREIFPTADFTDPSWGTCETALWSIEFNMGAEETCDSFALHVRGGGDAAAAVARLLDHLGLMALDTGSETGIFDKAAADAGFQRWQAYRDQVTGR